MAHINTVAKLQICIVSQFKISHLCQGYVPQLLFFLSNVNHFPKFSALWNNDPRPPNRSKCSLFCCQQYFCVDRRNLKIAAKLQDCNICNHLISMVVGFFSLKNTGRLILEQRSSDIKDIYYIKKKRY